jgi:hypothetical protein
MELFDKEMEHKVEATLGLESLCLKHQIDACVAARTSLYTRQACPKRNSQRRRMIIHVRSEF